VNDDLIQKLILDAIRRGEIPLTLNDEVVDCWLSGGASELTDAMKSRVKLRLDLQIQNAAIAQASRSAEKVGPFGRFIASIRERAGLSKADVAKRLEKSVERIEDIERGEILPSQLNTVELADIVEFFHITFRTVSEVLHASVRSLDRRSFESSEAVSTGLRKGRPREGVDRAIQGHAEERLPRNFRRAAPNIETCLVSLKEELERRQRSDLLG
jgi:transcriptional regulator with XRE-family HTH domain